MNLYLHPSRPYRDLEKDEIVILSKWIKEYRKAPQKQRNEISSGLVAHILLSVVYIGAFSSYFIINRLKEESFLSQLDESHIVIFVLAIVITFVYLLFMMILLWLQRIDQTKIEKDLESPVFLLQGEVDVLDAESEDYNLKIKNMRFFCNRMKKECVALLKSLKEGEAVSVEFSPRSRYVWKVERV